MLDFAADAEGKEPLDIGALEHAVEDDSGRNALEPRRGLDIY